MKFVFSLGTSSHISVYHSKRVYWNNLCYRFPRYAPRSFLTLWNVLYVHMYVILPVCYLLFLFHYCNFFRFCHVKYIRWFKFLVFYTKCFYVLTRHVFDNKHHVKNKQTNKQIKTLINIPKSSTVNVCSMSLRQLQVHL